MHIMPTLYTLIPMYLLSFKAGMLTFRVSQAKKQPNNWNSRRRKRWWLKELVNIQEKKKKIKLVYVPTW